MACCHPSGAVNAPTAATWLELMTATSRLPGCVGRVQLVVMLVNELTVLAAICRRVICVTGVTVAVGLLTDLVPLQVSVTRTQYERTVLIAGVVKVGLSDPTGVV